MTDFTMPSLGADMDSGTILEWLVKPGDVVKRGDVMAVVDTDKAAVEIETFEDGVVGEVLVQPGQRVGVGSVLATLVQAEEAAPAPAPRRRSAKKRPPRKAPAGTPVAAPRATPPVRHHAAELGVDLTAVAGTGTGGRVTRADVDAAARRPRTSPYARRLAAELGVDLSVVAGSGAGGTVVAEDVRAAAASGSRAAAATAGPRSPAVEVEEPRPAVRQSEASRTGRATIAALMSRSKREIPHYYVATTVDLQATVRWLRETNRQRAVSERIVPAAALLRGIALAARRMPELNGFWVDDRFVPGNDVHLGVAISVRGSALVAPALLGTADLALPELMHGLRDLVARARSGRLTRAELTEPTLTVTDLGDQGVEEVFGVIQPPQVALVGVGRMVERPWAVDGLLGVRPVVRLSLSGDHRATDGYTGARFLATVDELLQHPEEL